MALTGDEQHLIATANMHLLGRQVDPKQVRRDLWRLSQWERERLRRTPRSPGGVTAP
jgi:Ser/Thr protein kinase RdoA (MazF antagonist)